MRRVGLLNTVMGNVILAVQVNDDHTSVLLNPDEARQLANRLISYAAGNGNKFEDVISEGEDK